MTRLPNNDLSGALVVHELAQSNGQGDHDDTAELPAGAGYLTRGPFATFVLAALGAVWLLAGCGGKFNTRLGEDGIYRFVGHPIEVRVPERCLLDAYVYDSPQAVEFVTGRGFWEAGGRYALHVFLLPGEVVDESSFEARAERFFQRFLVEEPGQYRVKVQPVSQTALTVDGNPALRAIAVENGRAVFVATVRLHATRVSVASLLYPLEGDGPVDEQIPWSCYEGFVASVRELTAR